MSVRQSLTRFGCGDLLKECSQQKGRKGNRVKQRKKLNTDLVSTGVWLSLIPPGALEHELHQEVGPTLKQRPSRFVSTPVSWSLAWGRGDITSGVSLLTFNGGQFPGKGDSWELLRNQRPQNLGHACTGPLKSIWAGHQ